MITANRQQSAMSLYVKEIFEATLNEFRGLGFQPGDIEAVRNQKKEFNTFYSKVPPVFKPTPKQVLAGISQETKIFIMKILYLLPENMRREFVKNDFVTNKIIELFATKFTTDLDIGELSSDDRKEILYYAWFFYRLQDRQTQRGLVFPKSVIFSRAVFRVMATIIPHVDERNQELIETSRLVAKYVEPADHLNEYAQQLLKMMVSERKPNEVFEVAKEISDYVGPPTGLSVKTKESMDALTAAGYTLDQIEIVARYTWGRKSMQRNEFYFMVEHMAHILTTFNKYAAEHNWKPKEVPNLDNGEFERLVSVIFVAADPEAEFEICDFIGKFVAISYVCLLADENGDGILEHPDAMDFILFAIELFTNYTKISFEPDSNCLIPLEASPEASPETQTPNLEGNQQANQQADTIQAFTPPASEEANNVSLSPSFSNTTKDSQMNVTSSPQATPVSQAATMAFNPIVQPVASPMTFTKSEQELTFEETVMAQLSQHKKELADQEAKIATRDAKVDFAFETHQQRLDFNEKKQKETDERLVGLEQKVFGDEAAPILERIRAHAREAEICVSSSSSSSPSLSTTEAVVVSTVAVVAVSAIGYSLYRLFND